DSSVIIVVSAINQILGLATVFDHAPGRVHFLYQYSLDFLLDIFTCVLKSPELAGTQDHLQRLNIITANLFQTVYRRVSRGMLHADKVLLALLLMRISLRSAGGEPSYDAQWDLLLGRSELFASKTAHQSPPTALPFLTSQHMGAIIKAQKLPGFENMLDIMCARPDQIKEWMEMDNPEAAVPVLWEDPEQKLTAIGVAMNQLIVVHCLRSDRLMASAHRLVAAAFGDGFMQQDKVIDLHDIIDNEVSSSDPVLLCSAIGYDASGKIEDLGVQTGRPVTSIAIGSAEGFSQADAALTAASKSGRWVLLKNVHLAPQWLGNMENAYTHLNLTRTSGCSSHRSQSQPSTFTVCSTGNSSG
ncbi:dynein heavy chain, partial [Oesophagostomum dentatum]